MKKLYFVLVALLITTLSFGQIINEFQPNPVGSDPTNVNVELKGPPSTSFSGLILSVESDDGSSTGTVDSAAMVSGSFDANGLLVVSIPDLENPSFTLVLVSSFSGTAGSTDIDADNDGTFDDISTFGTVHDAIGIPDNTNDEDYVYGAQLGGADFTYTGDEPQLAFRDGTTDDWYAVNDTFGVPDTDAFDIDGNAVPGTSFDTDPTGDGTNATTTFGAVNPSFSTASTKENQIDGFDLYPNPTSEAFVNISSDSRAPMKVSVYDILGKQVIERTLTNNRLNVSNLNTGVYILRAQQDNAFTTRKLVIN